MITIIAIGKKHEDWVLPGIQRYEKRLAKPYDVNWILLPHSSLSDTLARNEESERIIAKLPEGHTVILLDERGAIWSSEQLAEKIEASFVQSKPVCFIVGGAYGVNDALRKHITFEWSLSNLVFPHQLVRLVVIEQVYRASTIAAGTPYHHA